MKSSHLKIGINGFGRIGRLICRLGFEKLSIVAVNGRSESEMAAHLLQYDSIHGPWNKKVSCSENTLHIEDQTIAYTKHSDPSQIPWEKYGVDIVIECAGKFKSKEDLQKHLSGSVQKVLIGAPAKGADFTLVWGVNHLSYDREKHHLISLSSCTTNCLAPLLHILHKRFSVEQAFMTTVHSYTNDQKLLDSSHKSDFRRARACGLNIIPTKTGAGKAIEQALPELKGKVRGLALRVPTPNVSLLDLSAKVKKSVTAQALSKVFQEAAKKDFKDVLAFEEAPLVSSDFIGRTESAIVDAPSLQVLEDHFVKALAWYDNEAGFSSRMIDFICFMERSG